MLSFIENVERNDISTTNSGLSSTQGSDGYGQEDHFTGFHKLLATAARVKSAEFSTKLLGLLDELEKNGVAKEYAEAKHGEFNETPLQFALKNRPMPEVVAALLEVSPETASMVNSLGQLPLHIACKFGASSDVISILVDTYPDAKVEQDMCGRTPLHHLFDQSLSPRQRIFTRGNSKSLLVNGQCLPPSNAVNMVLSNEHVFVPDNSGLTSFNLFAARVAQVKSTEKQLHHAEQILLMLLESEPPDSSDMTSVLNGLPHCLRKVALSRAPVKDILNEAIARPFPTSLLMMDFVVQLFLVCTFVTVVNDFFQMKYKEQMETAGLLGVGSIYVGTTYLLLREMSQIYSFIRFKMFWMWIIDPWNWLDVANIGLLLTSATWLLPAMKNHPSAVYANDWLHFLLMVTGGVQFVMLMAYLKATWLPFSVFVSGATSVLQALIPFLIASFIILAAFAYMFWVEAQGSPQCDEAKEGAISYCSLKMAVFEVYVHFVGGGMDQNEFHGSSGQKALTVLFAFFIVLIQLNLLIAIVTNAYMHVINKGYEVFWDHRLHYVTEIDAIRALLLRGDFCQVSEKHKNVSRHWRRAWQKACWKLSNDSFEFEFMERGRGKYICLWCGRVYLSLLIFFWLVAGTLTFGWLWPPQVREWLFCLGLENDEDELEDSGLTGQMATDIDGEMDMDKKMEQMEQRIHEKMEEIGRSVDDNMKALADAMIELQLQSQESKAILAAILSLRPRQTEDEMQKKQNAAA